MQRRAFPHVCIWLIAYDSSSRYFREHECRYTCIGSDVHDVAIPARFPFELVELIAVVVHNLGNHVVERSAMVGLDAERMSRMHESEGLFRDAPRWAESIRVDIDGQALPEKFPERRRH